MQAILSKVSDDPIYAKKILNTLDLAPLSMQNEITKVAIQSHIDVADQYKNHANPVLRKYSAVHESVAKKITFKGESDITVLEQCASHLSLAESLSSHHDEQVRSACAKHPELHDMFGRDTSIEVLKNLIMGSLVLAQEHSGHNNYQVRRACASHIEVAKILIDDADIRVKKACLGFLEIAKTQIKNASPAVRAECAKHEILAKKLFKDENNIVRAACAIHLVLAKKLLKDPSWIVRKECALHPTLSEFFIDDESAYVRSLCATDQRFGDHFKSDLNFNVLLNVSLTPGAASHVLDHENPIIACHAKNTMHLWAM